MTDDFLNSGDSSAFLDELIAEDKEPPPPPLPQRKSPKSSKGRKQSKSKSFMGMTPMQTFIVSAMFFFIILLLGFLFLMFTGKMVVAF